MSTKTKMLQDSRWAQALPIALLLILTAWGDAFTMFAASALALLGGMLLLTVPEHGQAFC